VEEPVEDRISGLKDKLDIKEKLEESLDKSLKNCKGIPKNSVIPLKDQIFESWALTETNTVLG
jgi:hypothetical protein